MTSRISPLRSPVRTDTEKIEGPGRSHRDPQPTDTGLKLTMLEAGDVGKFAGVATAGRWTPSSRFALRDDSPSTATASRSSATRIATGTVSIRTARNRRPSHAASDRDPALVLVLGDLDVHRGPDTSP